MSIVKGGPVVALPPSIDRKSVVAIRRYIDMNIDITNIL